MTQLDRTMEAPQYQPTRVEFDLVSPFEVVDTAALRKEVKISSPVGAIDAVISPNENGGIDVEVDGQITSIDPVSTLEGNRTLRVEKEGLQLTFKVAYLRDNPQAAPVVFFTPMVHSEDLVAA